MKKLLFIVILLCFGSMAFAQKVYFIYIQSDAGTPFYVKMGEKVYSSTASGYVILPKLVDSTYVLYLGQPGNQAKELRFSVPINNADRGFLLKNLQEGLALFDLQSMAVINPTPSTSGVMYESNTVKSDLFTRLLARAVDDSTLLMEPVLAKGNEPKPSKKEEIKNKAPKDKNEAIVKASEEVPAKEDVAINKTTVNTPVSTTPIVDNNNVKDAAVPQETQVPKDIAATKVTVSQSDSANLKVSATSRDTDAKDTSTLKDAVVQNVQKTDSIQGEPAKQEQTEFKRSVVKKYAESSNFQGFGLTFIDTWEGVTDTIRLVIPNVVDASALVKTELPKVDNQLSNEAIKDVPASNNNQVSATVINNDKDSLQTTVVKNEATPANCKEASNKDFLELRKNMAAKDRGEEMLAEARKAFNEKCYTTEQIRKLSVLFYTQEGKFLFFKEAKPFVSDKDRFATLLFELNEDAYQERFKSLLEN
ncbi:hypothetical protein OCK74_26590 [Chitinophagaceae bacterium LB-8]|uniref:DUF4476 domain-containing protein n=1 Tax=Paraflavisolibacter caeni TaxID=2982496 RepID=A0A9X2Y082_9BACT|nr:hypothetical protein [Paraflavisolibacter caeni]MCU7552716.1 hypothetical protein [Paraflavisolibacter caeni]